MNTPMKNVIQGPNISHFKAFDMANLQYEIRLPQKVYRRATINYWAWYVFLRNRRYAECRIMKFKYRNSSSVCPPYLPPFHMPDVGKLEFLKNSNWNQN